MPFLYTLQIRSGNLSQTGWIDFYLQKLSPSDSIHTKNDYVGKEQLPSPKRERAWNIPSLPVSGSMTIEASLCLTVFLVFMISFCQLFLLMQVQLRMQKALEQLGNETAQYCYLGNQVNLWESESKLLTELEEYLLAELSEEAVQLRFVDVMGQEALEKSVVKNGAAGLSFEESSLLRRGHRLQLAVSYQVRLPITWLGFGEVTLHQQCYRYGLLGDRTPAKTAEQEEELVYVTKYGEVYHKTLSCSYLNLSVRSVNMSQVDKLRNKGGGKYYACELCRPSGRELSVYVTSEGDRYHDERDCSGLRRHISSIPVSEKGERRPCTRCAKEEKSGMEQ